MTRRIDLHIHTSASDGTLSPAETVRRAHALGLSAIAITDHDTVAGFFEAAELGEALGLEVIPGIEISTRFDRAVHILGYRLDPKSTELAPVLDWVRRDRDERNRRMAELMAADGLPVSYEDMLHRYGDIIGRPHFAQMLVELGLASSVQDAFDRYVEKGQRYYLPRNFLSIEQSIEIILKAGGIPVLAHPFQYRLDDAGLRRLIEHCIAQGLRGMECIYSGYSERQVAYLEALCSEYGLIETGGSDFHGSNKPQIRMGELDIPYEFLQNLKNI